MSDAKFTRGEWVNDGEWVTCEGKPVCLMGDSWVSFDNYRENAYLIAVAPEMYEFIETVAAGKDADLEALKYIAVSWARNAEILLSKARGEL